MIDGVEYMSCRRCGTRLPIYAKSSGYCGSCARVRMARLDTSWMSAGACTQVGGEPFFPDKGGPTRAGKWICNGNPKRGTPACRVREACLAYALATRQEHGTWGGMSAHERARLLEQQDQAATA